MKLQYLRYPILQAIYGETHPEFASYMYLLAPISLVILNPIGFIILELSRASSVPNDTEVSRNKSKSKIIWQVIYQTFMPLFIDRSEVLTDKF